MKQEMFIHKIGNYDKKVIFNKVIAELNEKGLKVINIIDLSNNTYGFLTQEIESEDTTVINLTNEEGYDILGEFMKKFEDYQIQKEMDMSVLNVPKIT